MPGRCETPRFGTSGGGGAADVGRAQSAGCHRLGLARNTLRHVLRIGGNIKFGAVAIGRNEGERLRRCLTSLSAAAAVVYVDSGSTDGSAQWARSHGAEVIDLDMG